MPKVKRPSGMSEAERIEQSKRAFLYYFGKEGGNISRTVEAVKKTRVPRFKGSTASRSSYYRWTAEDPEFGSACDDVDAANLDEAETCISDAIKKGDTAAAKFLLLTKGKKRGYTKRTEITGAEGLPHRIEIVGSSSVPPVTDEDDIESINEIVIPE